MAEVETLDDLLGADPDASGNSDSETGQTGPDSPNTSQDQSAGGLEARIAELEQKLGRNTERLQGAEQSAMQWKTQAEQAQEAVQTLTGKLQEIAKGQQQTQQTAVPRDFVEAWTNMTGYEPSAEDAQRMYRALRGNEQPAQQTQTQDPGYVTRQELEAMSTQQRAAQAMVAAHPELQDANFLQEVIKEYDALLQDPMTQVLYPEEKSGPSVVNFWGRNFDLRLMDKATSSHKAKANTANEQRQGPTLTGSTTQNADRKSSPVIPKAFVGSDGVFSDPAIQKALATAGWGANTRNQVEKMLKHLTPAQRAEWERQRG